MDDEITVILNGHRRHRHNPGVIITERRGLEKQKAAWGEKMAEMKSLGIEYRPDWAAKAK